jgi:hypothetical protein
MESDLLEQHLAIICKHHVILYYRRRRLFVNLRHV